MIAKQDIQELLINKQKLSSIKTDDLREAVDYFPYATTFTLLYLESLFIQGDLRFQEELNRLAIRISDRSVLYELAGRQANNPVILNEDIIELTDRKQEINEEINRSDLSTLTQFDSDEEQPTTEDEKEFLRIENDPIENSVIEIDEVELLIQAGAAQANFIRETEKELDLITKASEQENSSDEIEKAPKHVVENPIFVSSPIEENEAIDEKEFTFNDWLNYTSTVQDREEETKNSLVIEKIDRPKKEFYSPSKKAKESLDEQKMPVSETLAKIFELQGNFPKAIYVYEQLSLIFPEKKTYFAGLIKQVKKKIN
jgi:hypothetical protein